MFSLQTLTLLIKFDVTPIFTLHDSFAKLPSPNGSVIQIRDNDLCRIVNLTAVGYAIGLLVGVHGRLEVVLVVQRYLND